MPAMNAVINTPAINVKISTGELMKSKLNCFSVRLFMYVMANLVMKSPAMADINTSSNDSLRN
jgi:hypothetical protein